MPNGEIRWERLASNGSGWVHRARIYGGWLVRIESEIVYRPYIANGTTTDDADSAFISSVTFVPDPDWEWAGEDPEVSA